MASSQLGARDDDWGTRQELVSVTCRQTHWYRRLSIAHRKTLLQVRTSYRRTSLYLVGPLTQVVIDDSWYRRRIGYEILPLCYHAD